MASTYLPAVSVERVLIGNTPVVNPILLITVDGKAYSSGYNYGTTRRFFATHEPATGNIYIVCYTTVTSSDAPAYTLANVGVLILG